MSTLLQKSSKKSLIREYGEALLVALVLAFVIRTFVVQAYKIPSESMVETLLVGDHLLASKFAYGIKIPFTHSYIYRGDDPAYGDIIIFEYPNDPSVDYIKRVIGLPGDVITVRDKRLYRNCLRSGRHWYQCLLWHRTAAARSDRWRTNALCWNRR